MTDKNPTNLEVIANEMKHMAADVSEIKADMKSGYVTKGEFEPIKHNYVSKTEFEPIKKAFYGLVGLILTSIVVAVLGLVLR